jgi:uncharacterized protein
MILSFLLATAATAAHPPAASPDRPAFACARAATLIERAICAEPALAARDRALAIAYGRNRREPKAAEEQLNWLASRDICTTVICTALVYDRRIEELMATGAGAGPQLSRGDDQGSLEMIDLGGGWRLFSISAVYVAPDRANINDGQAAGVVRIIAGRGAWQGEGLCRLRFRQTAAGWDVRQGGECEAGLNVTFGGVYEGLHY